MICADPNFDKYDESLSTSGVTVFHVQNLINWSSIKQESVAKLTWKAEMNAITEGAIEAKYLKVFMTELVGHKSESPIVIFNDSKLALDTLACGGKHARTQHYKWRIYYVKKLQKFRVVKVRHEGTKEMIADAFTKALPGRQLIYLIKKCGLDIDVRGLYTIESCSGGMLD